MARNRDRQFSESENLKFRIDQEYTQPEDRVSHWAAQGEEEREERRSYFSARNEDVFDVPGREAERKERSASVSPVRQGKKEADVYAAEGEDSSHQEAENAWRREAERVESTQPQYAAASENADEQDQGKEEEGEEKETVRPRTPPRRPAAPKASRAKKKKNQDDERRGFLRTLIIICVCFILFLMVGLMVLSNFVSHPLLALPRKWVTSIMTPVQNVFSDVTDSVVDYLRKLKVRGSIEDAYAEALSRIDELETNQARMKELEYENEQLQDLLGEHKNHEQFNPIVATVIGNDGGNYFATLTLNVGANDGVQEYMAVVSNGGLVGVTYEVEDNKCQVRCIINSDSTVAALVQSSRDQGSVKGTLGATGEAMCRMYYLPDNSLPRPGDTVVTSGVGLEFPKGIPIGYIRESTRGMDENKSYVVLEPIVDFQHLEYVTVYRYRPAYAESAQVREDNLQLELQAIPTVRPVPTFSMGGVSDFLFAVTQTPAPTQPGETPGPTQTPAPALEATATPDPNATQLPPNLEYIPNLPQDVTPSPSPRPTPSPTPTVAPTQNPGGMIVEDES